MITPLPRRLVLPLVARIQPAQAAPAWRIHQRLSFSLSRPPPNLADETDRFSIQQNKRRCHCWCVQAFTYPHRILTVPPAGGVVGGVAGLLIVAFLFFFWFRRRSARRGDKERPSLFIDHDDEAPNSQPLREDLPVHYQPEPFTASEPTDRASTPRPSTLFDRSERPVSQSLTYLSDPQRVASPDGTSTGLSSRKSPIPPSLRPINVIQHEDAGPSLPADNQEPETVELPPAYTNIRQAPA